MYVKPRKWLLRHNWHNARWQPWVGQHFAVAEIFRSRSVFSPFSLCLCDRACRKRKRFSPTNRCINIVRHVVFYWNLCYVDLYRPRMWDNWISSAKDSRPKIHQIGDVYYRDCAITTQYIFDLIFRFALSLFFFRLSRQIAVFQILNLRRVVCFTAVEETTRRTRNRLLRLFDNLTPKRLCKYYMYR